MWWRIGVVGLLVLAASCATQPQGPAKPSAPAVSQPPVAPKPAATPSASRPANEWKTNAAGLAIIENSEGLRLQAYQNGSQWLIGYGHARGVTAGMTITQEQAEDFLRDDVLMCEAVVVDSVKVQVTQNEFSAMVSLCYNIGPHTFSQASLVTALNSGDRAGAADGFLAWDKGKVNGVKAEIPYLKTRREKERTLFLS